MPIESATKIAINIRTTFTMTRFAERTKPIDRVVALASSAEQPIRQVLADSFDKPGSALAVDPIVVANDDAIAD